jgi:isopentenyldiphosphate isomerase
VGHDAADELVDVLDDAGRVIATTTRAEMRAQRLRHRAVFVLVVSSDGRLLVHRRSEDKDVWPGRWDLAAGGVLRAGEDDEAGARREIAEELGVELGELELVAEGAYRDERVDEVARVFRARHDGPFRFADGEIVEAHFLDRPALDALIATGAVVPDSLALVPLDAVLPPDPAPGPTPSPSSRER